MTIEALRNDTDLQLKLNYLRDMWQEFCEKHTELYEKTCDEYMHLLSSDIDALETTVNEKKNVINYINKLEQARNEVTNEVTQFYGIDRTEKLSFLLNHLKENGENNIATQIEKLNLVLLDIVEKIQEQNKKNQFFLNKAIHSLNELKESFTGKTNYKTYSSSGMATNNNTY